MAGTDSLSHSSSLFLISSPSLLFSSSFASSSCSSSSALAAAFSFSPFASMAFFVCQLSAKSLCKTEDTESVLDVSGKALLAELSAGRPEVDTSNSGSGQPIK